MFRGCGAYLDGHFLLASGRHSPRYLEKFRVLQWPERTARLCAAIAERARPLDATTVAGPTTGGVILAYEVARQLGLRAVYAERADDGRGRELRRFRLEPDERVLVVDDIFSTGGSLRETVEAVQAAGGKVVGAAVLADRSGGVRLEGTPLVALWEVALESHAPAECPQCAAGIPLDKPGTTPAPALRR